MIKKRKKKRKLRWYLVTTSILIIAAIALTNFSKGIYRIWHLSRIESAEEKALNRAIEEKKKLEHKIEQLKTDSLYIEEIARKEYGMVKNGEEVYHITLPDTAKEVKKDVR